MWKSIWNKKDSSTINDPDYFIELGNYYFELSIIELDLDEHSKARNYNALAIEFFKLAIGLSQIEKDKKKAGELLTKAFKMKDLLYYKNYAPQNNIPEKKDPVQQLEQEILTVGLSEKYDDQNIKEQEESLNIDGVLQGLMGSFNVPLGYSYVMDWQWQVIILLNYFLNQVKESIKNNTIKYEVKSIIISYVEDKDERSSIKSVVATLKYLFEQIDISVDCAPLETTDLKDIISSPDSTTMIILCTPKYAEIMSLYPMMRKEINNFGKKRADALHALLCDGDFFDTAFKIVDSHFLIRDCKKILNQDPLIQLPFFIDVLFNLSGINGLGILPDILDLEKDYNAKVRFEYKKLFLELENLMQNLIIDYYITSDLNNLCERNVLKNIQIEAINQKKVEDVILSLKKEQACKVSLLLCFRIEELALTNMLLEQILLKKKLLVLSINCEDYTLEQTSHYAVKLALKKLKFKNIDIEKLRQDHEIIIIFKNYEKLNAYDNLYVRNKLYGWTKIKVIVTCLAEHFQHRDYKSCFLSDPSNPQLNSLNVSRIDYNLSIEILEKIKELMDSQTITTSSNYLMDYQEELFLSPKKQAIIEEFNLFLKQINILSKRYQLLEDNIDDNPHIFISYAWESDPKALALQQSHLRQLAQDLTVLGFPTWLDIERMTGNIDQQMSGNIDNSKFILIIATPRYAYRAMINSNVKKEYDAILEKAKNFSKKDKIKVIPVLFTKEKYDIYLLSEEHYPIKLPECLEPILIYDKDKKIKYLVIKEQEKKIELPPEYNESLSQLVKEHLKEAKITENGVLISLNDSSYTDKKIINWLNSRGYKPFTDKSGNGDITIVAYSSINKISVLQEYNNPQIIKIPIEEKPNLQELIEKNLQNRDGPVKVSLDINSPILTWLVKQGCPSGHFRYVLDKIQKVKDLDLDFTCIDNQENYIRELTEKLIPNLLDLKSTSLFFQKEYQIEKENLHKELQLIPGKYLLIDAGQELIQAYDIDNRLKAYIECYALKSEHQTNNPENRFNLNKKVESFLIGNTKTFVILGKAGSGKSLFVLFFFQKLLKCWHLYKLEKKHYPEWLPIYLPLKNYAQARAVDAIRLSLIEYGLEKKDIEELKQGLGRSQKVLFILDGYDELGKNINHNFSKDLENWPYAKVLISGRIDHFENERQHFDAFGSLSFNEQLNCSSFEVNYLAPFVIEEIKDYIEKYMNVNPECKQNLDCLKKNTNKEIYEILESLPGLISLLDNPFLLNLVLQSLPMLLESKTSQSNLTRKEIYEAFVDTWFIKEAARQNALGRKVEKNECREFAEKLAFLMFKNKTINVNNEMDFFIEPKNLIMRETCPLSINGNGYSFIHKSIYEYFVASYLYKELEKFQHDKELISWGERPLTDEPAIINFLVEIQRSQQQPTSIFEDTETSKILFKLIEYSSSKLQKCYAASNAATVLNAAGISFSGRDLKKSNLVGASLIGAILDSTNLEGADLSKANLTGAWLRGSDLTNTNMLEVFFSELAYKKESASINSCIYSSNGDYLAVVTSCNLILYKVNKSGHLISKNIIPNSYNSFMTCVAFSHDSRWVAVSGWDNMVNIFNLNNFEKSITLTANTNFISSISFNIDNQLLAASSIDSNIIIIWDLEKRTIITTLSGHDNSITNVLFSYDNKFIISGSIDKTIRFWNLSDFTINKIITLDNAIRSIALSLDSRWLALGGENKNILIYSLEDTCSKKILEGHTDSVLSVTFSTDSKWLASGSTDCTIRIWRLENINDNTVLAGHTNYVTGVVFSSSNEVLASVSLDKTIRLWNLTFSGNHIEKHIDFHDNYVYSIAVSNDNRWLASGSRDNSIRVWDLASLMKTVRINAHNDYVYSVSFSHDNQYMASASRDGTIKLFNLKDFSHYKTFHDHNGPVLGIHFSYNNKWLASTSVDKTVIMWDLINSTQKILFEHDAHLRSIAFSYNNKWLVVAGGGNENILGWNLLDNTETPCFKMHGHNNDVLEVNFSYDSQWLVSGSIDKSIMVWFLDDPNNINYKLAGHEGAVYSVKFSPDDKFLISGSTDKTLRIWKNNLLNPNHDKKLECFSIIFTNFLATSIIYKEINANLYIITAGDDNSIRLWQQLDNKLMLLWNTHQKILDTYLANITGATLSQQNLELLLQSGAVIKESSIIEQRSNQNLLFSENRYSLPFIVQKQEGVEPEEKKHARNRITL